MEWLFYLGVIMLAAKLGAEVVQRVGMSAVIGEIAVGVLLGHSLFNVIPESELVEALADMGVLFMIFLLGLETKVAHVLEVGLTALLVALGGIVLPFALGVLAGFEPYANREGASFSTPGENNDKSARLFSDHE